MSLQRSLSWSSAHCDLKDDRKRRPVGALGAQASIAFKARPPVHHLGLALGGRPAASFARRLMVPASRDTLLRTVRRRATRPAERPTVIGIDDWALRRGQRYGTLVCDLERRRVVALLPDRESGTVEAWLAAHREIAIVARDRGGSYGEATARALPHAVQVA